MTKLEMVIAILQPKTAYQRRYAEMVAKSHRKEDIAVQYEKAMKKNGGSAK